MNKLPLVGTDAWRKLEQAMKREGYTPALISKARKLSAKQNNTFFDTAKIRPNQVTQGNGLKCDGSSGSIHAVERMPTVGAKISRKLSFS